MSKKSEALHAFRSAAQKAAGSHETRDARLQTAERLVSTLYEKGYQVRDVDSLGTRHVKAYVDARLADGVSARTLQKEMSHVRGMLRAEGRADLAANKVIDNKTLGIAGVSRNGTNAAIDRETASRIADRLGQVDPGLRAMVHLARELGLRSTEAVRCGPSLATWEKQLSNGMKATVVYGTKGGKPREAAPADRQRALAAVQEARAIAKANGGKLLPGTLRQAQNLARNHMSTKAREAVPELRATWHSCRYAYAQDRMQSYRDAGFSEHEARSLTSTDLGHGDGRGTYVHQVYAQG